QAVGPAVGIYDAPEGAYLGDLYNPLPSGAERVFLVTGARDDWYEVLLPVRPNQRKGWVRGSEVSISSHSYSMVIELGVHRLTVFEGEAPIQVERIGVGKANTPTPGGLYYTKELIEIVDGAGRLYPHGPYGPFAFGLSGFSEVFRSFGDGGDGTVGIHGTDDPSSLGRDVSAGCIRMSNEAVTRLAGLLPLGVPVEIRP
ncbi:MAG TPA: L,D-transpeptidase, partial [Acidimicrobiales bacterium]|nr:L,D-transpeptidase [Acidimicrobiales bacterium]